MRHADDAYSGPGNGMPAWEAVWHQSVARLCRNRSGTRTRHVRETATPSDFLEADVLAEVFAQTGVTPGPVIVADCSCGAVYAVPQGDDEHGALEAAHAKHVQEAD